MATTTIVITAGYSFHVDADLAERHIRVATTPGEERTQIENEIEATLRDNEALRFGQARQIRDLRGE